MFVRGIRPKRYVLVHGAWHGSWCWRKVTSRLQELGHEVITPDLPGNCGQQHDFKDITLSSYVGSIESILHQGSQPVVLVGHSMAGVVISQVAENLPDKIEQLIYISAFIPRNGYSLMDEEKQAVIPTVAKEVVVNQEECSLRLNPSPRIADLFYGYCCEADKGYALSSLQPQPLRPFTDPLSISAARFGRVPKLYIECLQDKAVMIRNQRRMHGRIPCDVASLDTDHSPFFSADRALVSVICGRQAN